MATHEYGTFARQIPFYYPSLFTQYRQWIDSRYKAVEYVDALTDLDVHIKYLRTRDVFVTVLKGELKGINATMRKHVYSWNITEDVVLGGEHKLYTNETNMYTTKKQEAYELAVMNGYRILHAKENGVKKRFILDDGTELTKVGTADEFRTKILNDDISPKTGE